MKAQFGNKQLINVTTEQQFGLGVVVAEGYRVVSHCGHSASERLSPDCRGSMRSLRQKPQDRRSQSIIAGWLSDTRRVIPTVDPGATTETAMPAVGSRLPAPAWAAFVLNHALCG